MNVVYIRDYKKSVENEEKSIILHRFFSNLHFGKHNLVWYDFKLACNTSLYLRYILISYIHIFRFNYEKNSIRCKVNTLRLYINYYSIFIE